MTGDPHPTNPFALLAAYAATILRPRPKTPKPGGRRRAPGRRRRGQTASYIIRPETRPDTREDTEPCA